MSKLVDELMSVFLDRRRKIFCTKKSRSTGFVSSHAQQPMAFLTPDWPSHFYPFNHRPQRPKTPLRTTHPPARPTLRPPSPTPPPT